MADSARRAWRTPDDVIEFPGTRRGSSSSATSRSASSSRSRAGAGRRHVAPRIGGEWCQARHVGFISPGRLGIDFSDGTTLEFGPATSSTSRPGHDGCTIGDEPCVQIEWAGLRAFAGFPTGIHSRVLATLLFTDLVGSTEMAPRAGRRRWRELLSRHFEAAPAELERFGGREVNDDGRRVAGDVRRAGEGAPLRGGDQAGGEPRRAPHSRGCARRRGRARRPERSRRHRPRGGAHHGGRSRDEILVSDLTRALAGASGLAVRRSRHAHAQGPRGRMAPRRVRHRAGAATGMTRPLTTSSGDPRRRLRPGGAREDHRGAAALRSGLPGRLRPVGGRRAVAARGDAGLRKASGGRARGSRMGRQRGGAARARQPPASAHEASAADPVGRLGGRGDRTGNPAGDDVRAHRLLRAEALDVARRALPPHRLRVPPGVEARDRDGSSSRSSPIPFRRRATSSETCSPGTGSRMRSGRANRRGPGAATDLRPRSARTPPSWYCRTTRSSSIRRPRTWPQRGYHVPTELDDPGTFDVLIVERDRPGWLPPSMHRRRASAPSSWSTSRSGARPARARGSGTISASSAASRGESSRRAPTSRPGSSGRHSFSRAT